MIFIDNTLACPRYYDNATKKLKPAWQVAESYAAKAETAYSSANDKNFAEMKLQRVALAASVKAGDTSVQVEKMVFGAEVEANTLRAASDGLNRPVFFPKVAETRARIGALAHLTGSPKVQQADLERPLSSARLHQQRRRGLRRCRGRDQHGEAGLLRPGGPLRRLCPAEPETEPAVALRRPGDERQRDPVHQRPDRRRRRLPYLYRRPADAA